MMMTDDEALDTAMTVDTAEAPRAEIMSTGEEAVVGSPRPAENGFNDTTNDEVEVENRSELDALSPDGESDGGLPASGTDLEDGELEDGELEDDDGDQQEAPPPLPSPQQLEAGEQPSPPAEDEPAEERTEAAVSSPAASESRRSPSNAERSHRHRKKTRERRRRREDAVDRDRQDEECEEAAMYGHNSGDVSPRDSYSGGAISPRGPYSGGAGSPRGSYSASVDYDYFNSHDEFRDDEVSARFKRRRLDRGYQKSSAICSYFMQGKCHRGRGCPFSHNAVPPRKMELCKFYLMNCCAKRDKCLYLHKGFPCKFYHTGAECFPDEKCKFSHDPLNDITRSILLKHLETAPVEILGDFPRMSRPETLQMVQIANTKRANNELPNFTFPNLEICRKRHQVTDTFDSRHPDNERSGRHRRGERGSSSRRSYSPPEHEARGAGRSPPGALLPGRGSQERRDRRHRSPAVATDASLDQQEPGDFSRDRQDARERWGPGGSRTDGRRGGRRFRPLRPHETDEDGGRHGEERRRAARRSEEDGDEASAGASRRRHGSPPSGRRRAPPSRQRRGSGDGDNRWRHESTRRRSGHGSGEERRAPSPERESERTAPRHRDREEGDGGSPGHQPPVMPAQQRHLYMRIQQQQRAALPPAEVTPQPSDEDMDNPAEEDWYSTDDEKTPLIADVLKKMSGTMAVDASKTADEGSAADSIISPAVSQLLTTLRKSAAAQDSGKRSFSEMNSGGNDSAVGPPNDPRSHQLTSHRPGSDLMSRASSTDRELRFPGSLPQDSRMRAADPRSSMDPRARDMDLRSGNMDTRLRDMDPRSRDMDSRSRDMDRRSRDMDPRSRDMDPRSRDMDPRSRDMDLRSRDMDPRTRDMDPRSRDMNPRSMDMNPRSRDMNPRLMDMDPRSIDMDPRSIEMDPRSRDMSSRSRDMDPRSRNTDPHSRDSNCSSRDIGPYSSLIDSRRPPTNPFCNDLDPRSDPSAVVSHAYDVGADRNDVDPRRGGGPVDPDPRLGSGDSALLDGRVGGSTAELDLNRAPCWPEQATEWDLGAPPPPHIDSMPLPFKPVDIQPCVEIDASLSAHPAMLWLVVELLVPRRDYSAARQRLSEVACRLDPRLRGTGHRRRSSSSQDEQPPPVKQLQPPRARDPRRAAPSTALPPPPITPNVSVPPPPLAGRMAVPPPSGGGGGLLPTPPLAMYTGEPLPLMADYRQSGPPPHSLAMSYPPLQQQPPPPLREVSRDPRLTTARGGGSFPPLI